MITDQERESIINAAIERMVLSLPEIIGNLINNHVALTKINREFYKAHPELSKHKDIVASVLEDVEGKNTSDDYDKLLEQALPEIKKRVEEITSLSTEKISKPNTILDFGDL